MLTNERKDQLTKEAVVAIEKMCRLSGMTLKGMDKKLFKLLVDVYIEGARMAIRFNQN